MPRFYVLRGKRALWNLLIIAAIIFALFFVFKDNKEPEPKMPPDFEVGGGGSENLVIVEPVTVRPIPTKFAEYKLERERMRSRQMEFLQNLAYDAQTESERRAEAQRELQELMDKMSRETEIENLLKAKGYLDGLVILEQDTITVVVPVTLMREEAARIGELVNRLTSIPLNKITIIDETIGV